MKEKEKNIGKDIENNLESNVSKSRFIPSNNIDYLIRNLSNPKFLGSIHLKKEMNPNYNQVKDLIMSNHQAKLTKSLKSTIINPLTKILIISAIIFNIIWCVLVSLF